jgi:hypothetical protein
MDVLRATTQISTYNLVAFFSHTQHVQLIRSAIKIMISSALCEKIIKVTHVHN